MMSVVNKIVQSSSGDPEKVLLNVVLVYCALLVNMSNALNIICMSEKYT